MLQFGKFSLRKSAWPAKILREQNTKLTGNPPLSRYIVLLIFYKRIFEFEHNEPGTTNTGG